LKGRMPDARLERLVLAIAAGVGIDALIWLTDIAGLSREQAVEVMRWSAVALLRSALAEEEAEPQADDPRPAYWRDVGGPWVG